MAQTPEQRAARAAAKAAAAAAAKAVPPAGPPPALLLLGPFLIAYLIHTYVWPWPIPYENVVRPIGSAIVIFALYAMYSATAEQRRAGTTVVAGKPNSALVTTGPFRITRHPAYLAQLLFYVGACLFIGTWTPLVLFPLVVAAFHFVVIKPEERYLAQRFGNEWTAYAARVRGWL